MFKKEKTNFPKKKIKSLEVGTLFEACVAETFDIKHLKNVLLLSVMYDIVHIFTK